MKRKICCLQVEATDVDSGNNGAVSYFVETTSNSGQSTGLFSVSPQSGRLTVTREFESSSNYSEIVTVAARQVHVSYFAKPFKKRAFCG